MSYVLDTPNYILFLKQAHISTFPFNAFFFFFLTIWYSFLSFRTLTHLEIVTFKDC